MQHVVLVFYRIPAALSGDRQLVHRPGEAICCATCCARSADLTPAHSVLVPSEAGRLRAEGRVILRLAKETLIFPGKVILIDEWPNLTLNQWVVGSSPTRGNLPNPSLHASHRRVASQRPPNLRVLSQAPPLPSMSWLYFSGSTARSIIAVLMVHQPAK
jgi:hypothetical protein